MIDMTVLLASSGADDGVEQKVIIIDDRSGIDHGSRACNIPPENLAPTDRATFAWLSFRRRLSAGLSFYSFLPRAFLTGALRRSGTAVPAARSSEMSPIGCNIAAVGVGATGLILAVLSNIYISS
jgi:hypothetical protein